MMAGAAKLLHANPELCTGCRICELVCSMRLTGMISLQRAAIHITPRAELGQFEVTICRHCKRPLCMEACPVPGAMSFHSKLAGIVVIDPHLCNSCMACAESCAFGAIQRGPSGVMHKCDLCDGDPLCVRYCPNRPANLNPNYPLPEGMALEYVAPEDVQRFKKRLMQEKAQRGNAR
ncbi:MAG: 4Fe-4S dicluster domain-containing protein [Chloroflexota bacterium]|nr:MAG: 4Fe-4S dicluster domain-containing protein [Chloroflexota bacterium]